jgi:uncharacterized OB-fold protein
LAPDVFTWPSPTPQLIGGRCDACAVVVFPMQLSCPRCGARSVQRHLLPRRGHLYSWTTQEFLPREPYLGARHPERFVPFGVGLVQLTEDLMVEARLTVGDAGRLEFGMSVELVVVPLGEDEHGNEVLMFAFSPTKEEG